MLVKERKGTLKDYSSATAKIDYLNLEWYERSKRILHKKTNSGKEIILKFLKEDPQWQQDDVLFADEKSIIAININECTVITIAPKNSYEIAMVCYEIGNKHLPLFYEEGKLMIPYETPIFCMLSAWAFEMVKEEKKLLHPLRTTVQAHAHTESKSLFSRILQLTAPNE